jgi:hypothetical protein
MRPDLPGRTFRQVQARIHQMTKKLSRRPALLARFTDKRDPADDPAVLLLDHPHAGPLSPAHTRSGSRPLHREAAVACPDNRTRPHPRTPARGHRRRRTARRLHRPQTRPRPRPGPGAARARRRRRAEVRSWPASSASAARPSTATYGSLQQASASDLCIELFRTPSLTGPSRFAVHWGAVSSLCSRRRSATRARRTVSTPLPGPDATTRRR